MNEPTTPPTTAPPIAFDAVVFDMDGVVTDTARLHALAWQWVFDDVLPRLAPEWPDADVSPFDPELDYLRHIDGRPREDGVRAFLLSRGIQLPHEPVTDAAPAPSTVTTATATATRPAPTCVLEVGALKQQAFDDVLTAHGVTPFADAVHLLDRLGAAGVPVALVTSSRNAPAVLAAAGLTERFAAKVDGNDLITLDIPGKPDPAMFLEAARRLGIAPSRAVVFEDAEAGVRAAQDGGFGLVVGVARHNDGHGNRLLSAGADVVVAEVTGIDLAEPPRAFEHGWAPSGSSEPWLLRYEGYDPATEGQREALCTLGNGYIATRGAGEEAVADGIHYPGTYFAGVYNRVRTPLPGRVVEDEHLVNAPNWLPITASIDGGEWMRPTQRNCSDYVQELDLRTGILSRSMRITDDAGRRTRIISRRFVSQHSNHYGCQITSYIAENWTGTLTVRSAIEGRVANRNVAEYNLLEDHHLVPVSAEAIDNEHLLLQSRTNQSGVTIAIGVRNRIAVDGEWITPTPRPVPAPGYIGHEYDVTMERGTTVTVEKVALFSSSRDRALSEPGYATLAWLRRVGSSVDLEAEHRAAWARLWSEFEVAIDGDEQQSLALNVNTFHVLQTVAAADPDLDAGMPARGLHGEGYRGHIFWDEIFVYPILTMRRPDLSRALLSYRHRRLGEARSAAAAEGHRGAMFPWQSGIDGREETPTHLYNVRNARWMPDRSHRQRHVGLAIAYGVWQYIEVTDDHEFLLNRGLELLVEVSRFFASLATYDPETDRYSIDGVMGPDEFHDGYPGAAEGGLRDNAYTNVLTSWVLQRTLDAIAMVELRTYHPVWLRLRLTQRERDQWRYMASRLRVVFHEDGVISQFDGYEELREFDWEGYRAKYERIGRLDLILNAEGDTTNNYRLSKQPDTLMLFYLFGAEEVRELLANLGYEFPPDAMVRTKDFYTRRSTHGSTLSNVVHSWVAARGNRPESWQFLIQALDSDLADIQGGTTREGVHLGAMAGSVDMVVRCYTGLEFRGDALWFNPVLPRELNRVRFQMYYRRQPIQVDITRDRMRLTLAPSDAEPVLVRTPGRAARLTAGETRDFTLSTE